jgi:hypothetical protein
MVTGTLQPNIEYARAHQCFSELPLLDWEGRLQPMFLAWG